MAMGPDRGIIDAAIEDGRLDEAEVLLERSRLNPAARSAIRLRIARRRGDWPRVVALLEAVAADAPDNAKVQQNLALAREKARAFTGAQMRARINERLDAGQVEEAKALLDQAELNPAVSAAIALRIAQLRNDWPQVVTLLESALASAPDDVRLRQRLARARDNARAGAGLAIRTRFIEYLNADRLDEAEALLASPELGANLHEELLLRLVRKRQDWPRLIEILHRSAGEGRLDLPALIDLSHAHAELGQWTQATQAAQEALALQPENLSALQVAQAAAAGIADFDAVLRYARELTRVAPDNMRLGLAYVRILNTLGQVEDSAIEYKRLCARTPNDPLLRIFGLRYFAHDPEELRAYLQPADATVTQRMTVAQRRVAIFVQNQIDGMRALFDAAPADAMLRRPLVREHAEQHVTAIAVPGAAVCVIVFTGFQDQVMGVPIPLFDRFLAALGVSAIYLKDSQRLFYLGGMPSLGNGYDATLAALRQRVTEMGVARLVTLGASGGGLPAVRYGVDLGATAAISFGGRSTHEVLGQEVNKDPWSELVQTRMRVLGLEPLADLVPFLEGRTHATRIDLVYGAEMTTDTLHATRLRDLPGVVLHPIDGLATHAVIDHLIEIGALLPLLSRLIDVDG